MIKNIKPRLQPLMVGDLVRVFSDDYRVMFIKKSPSGEFRIGLFKDFKSVGEIEDYINDNIDYDFYFEVDLDLVYSPNPTLSGLSNVSGVKSMALTSYDFDDFNFVSRPFLGLSDFVCKYYCQLNDSNLADNKCCELCKYNFSCSPSDVFFIGDEVMMLTKYKDKIEREITNIIGLALNGLGELITELRNLSTLSSKSLSKRVKITDSIKDKFSKYRNIITDKLLFLNSIDYISSSIKSQNRSSLRLRNRYGFIYDYYTSPDLCEGCLFNNCLECNYKEFKNELNEIVKPILKSKQQL